MIKSKYHSSYVHVFDLSKIPWHQVKMIAYMIPDSTLKSAIRCLAEKLYEISFNLKNMILNKDTIRKYFILEEEIAKRQWGAMGKKDRKKYQLKHNKLTIRNALRRELARKYKIEPQLYAQRIFNH